MTDAVYGYPPAELCEVAPGVRQLSPLVPGSDAIEALPDASLGRITVLAPPGTAERRCVLASALRALRTGGTLVALAPKARGGERLAEDLAAFGCEPSRTSRRHFRIVQAERPERPIGVEAAIAAGAPRFDPALDLWTQAGVFASDRIDRGSRLLLDHLPVLAGRGADLGCGLGVLSCAVLRSDAVESLILIDIDRRAMDAARRNVRDPRAGFRWADLREPQPDLVNLDFAVTNPPFHDAGAEDRTLGQTFIRRAAATLRRGGLLFAVANRHLPYEDTLRTSFKTVRVAAEADGYKLFEARL